jgi:RNA polymerase sigma-70 factor (ECF subfamily)
MQTISFHETSSETDLVKCAREGDGDAFLTLVNRFHTRAFHIARQITPDPAEAEDTLIRALVTAYTQLDQCREGDEFYPWLVKLVVHEALQKVSGGSRQEVPSNEFGIADLAREISPWRGRPQEQLKPQELSRILEDAMQTLHPRTLAAFVLADMEGMSVEYAADVLDRPLREVKNSLLRARLQLSAALSSRLRSWM